MTPVIAGGGVDIPAAAKTRGMEAGPDFSGHSPLYGAAHDDDGRDGVLLNRLDAQHGGRALYGIQGPGSAAFFAHVEPERQFYTAKAPVVRYYENLRVVYEVESRMHELRRTTETEERKPAPQPEQQQKPATPNDNGGSARKNGGKSESPRTAGPPTIFAGRPLLASLQCLPEEDGSLPRLSLQQQRQPVCSRKEQTRQKGAWHELRKSS